MIALVRMPRAQRPEAQQQQCHEGADGDGEERRRPRRTPTVLGSAVLHSSGSVRISRKLSSPTPGRPALPQLAQAEVLEGEHADPEQRVDAAAPPSTSRAGAWSSHGSQPGVRPPRPRCAPRAGAGTGSGSPGWSAVPLGSACAVLVTGVSRSLLKISSISLAACRRGVGDGAVTGEDRLQHRRRRSSCPAPGRTAASPGRSRRPRASVGERRDERVVLRLHLLEQGRWCRGSSRSGRPTSRRARRWLIILHQRPGEVLVLGGLEDPRGASRRGTTARAAVGAGDRERRRSCP